MDLYTINSTATSLSAATAKTLLQAASPADKRLWVHSFSVSFNSVTSSDAPVVVDLMRQTTAGTGTSVTPVPLDGNAPASTSTCLRSHTVEPSSGDILWSGYVTPVGGLFVYTFSPGEEPIVDESGGFQPRIALRATSPSAVSVIASLTFAE